MIALKARFDGKVFVPDEPVALPQGQSVRLIVESPVIDPPDVPARKPIAGFAKGMFIMRDDFNDPLDDFAEYERPASSSTRRR